MSKRVTAHAAKAYSSREWLQTSLIQTGFHPDTAVRLNQSALSLPAGRSQLVLGGARVGKSRYLLANALSIAKANTNNERVLFLAASDNAVRNARRFLELYAPMGHHNYELHTPASFASNITRETGISGRTSPYSAQAMLLHTCLDTSHVIKHLRPFGNSTFIVNKLLSYFRTLQALGISPEALLDRASRMDRDDVKREVSLEQARLFRTFIDLKTTHGVWANEDAVSLAASQLGASFVSDDVNRRFSHVFIDDAQLLSPPSVDMLQSLRISKLAVDVAQDTSIFGKWSEAAGCYSPPWVDLLQQKDTWHVIDIQPQGAVVDPVMAAWRTASVPMTSEMQRFQLREQLVAAGVALEEETVTPLAETNVQVTYAPFDSPMAELQGLCEAIRTRAIANGSAQEQGEAEEEGVKRFASQAVMVPAWGDMDDVCKALATEGIPFYCAFKGGQRLFEVPIIRMLLDIFHQITNPTDDKSLHGLMSGCVRYHVPPLILAKLMELRKYRYATLFDTMTEISNALAAGTDHPAVQHLLATPEIAQLQQLHQSKDVPYGVLQGLMNLGQDLQHFSTVATHTGTTDLLKQILGRLDMLDKYKNPSNESEDVEAAALAKFLTALRQAETTAASDRMVFVEPVLALMQSYNADGTVYDSDATIDSSSDAVHVLPLSLAKDYDRHFRVVHLPFLTEERFPGRLKETHPIPLDLLGAEPTTGANTGVEEHLNLLVSHERYHARLLYAAAERSTHEVIMSSVNNSRSVASSIVAEVLLPLTNGTEPLETPTEAPKQTVDPITGRTPEDDVLDAIFGPLSVDQSQQLAARAQSRKKVSLQRIFDDPILHRPYEAPSPIRLSYSSLSTYRRCKYAFYLEHVLGVKSPQSAVMMYGTAMHAVAEYCVQQLLAGVQPSVEELKSQLRTHWNPLRVVFDNPTQEQQLLEEGERGVESFLHKILTDQDPHFRYPWQPASPNDTRKVRVPELLEHRFELTLPELGVLLVGVFDRVDSIRNDADAADESNPRLIVDYKSHMGKKDPATVVEASLQLKIYGFAHEKLFGQRPSAAVLESIEEAKYGWKTLSETDTKIAYGAIRNAAQGIRSGNFTPSSTSVACRYCAHRNTCEYSSFNSEAKPRSIVSDV